MRHASPLLFVMMVIALVGTAFAQSDTGSTDPSTATPTVQGDSPTPPSSPPSDGSIEPSQPSAAPAAAQGSAAGSGSTPSGGSTREGTLPATASGAPVLLGIGLAAIGAFVALLLWRKPRTARS